jgi:hypothetical protein
LHERQANGKSPGNLQFPLSAPLPDLIGMLLFAVLADALLLGFAYRAEERPQELADQVGDGGYGN